MLIDGYKYFEINKLEKSIDTDYVTSLKSTDTKSSIDISTYNIGIY